MKLGLALVVVAGLATGRALLAQAPVQPQKPADTQKQNPPAANPFPEDTGNVPLMPNGNAPAVPERPANASAPSALPQGDVDPVRSPDDLPSDNASEAQGFSSSSAGLDNVMPPPDTDLGHRKGKNESPPEHQESAQEDEKVGAYYLDEKNWKAALSRFDSAVVLDPDNPEVLWGLGEAQRLLGKFSEA